MPLTALRLFAEDFPWSDADLAVLRGAPLTALDLSRWVFTDDGLDRLRGMSMAELEMNTLDAYSGTITDIGLGALKGMSLTSLHLRGFHGITAIGLEVLRGMLLATLDLSLCPFLHGLAPLEGLPLTSLNVACTGVVNRDLERLRGMPLTTLVLSGCLHLTSAGLPALEGLPLRVLHLEGCRGRIPETIVGSSLEAVASF